MQRLARALGAKHSISSTTRHAKAEQAKALGFSEVIDLSTERLTDGVNRLTDGYGADIIVDSLGGNILSEALQILAPGGSLTTLGYTRVATNTIRDVMSPLDRLTPLKSGGNKPPA